MRFATSLTLLALAPGTAFAQAALDEGTPEPTVAPTASPTTMETTDTKVEYGVDLRLRRVFVPKGLLELFVERSAGGASNTGFGVDLVRRRGTLELQLGFEFEHIEVGEGAWINKGDNVPSAEADYIISADRAGTALGWFTVEFTFLNHAVINKMFSVRYGGGAGIGFVTGELQKYDVICAGTATNDNPEPGCTPSALGGMGSDPDNSPEPYDLPPVFPVVNAIIGLQIKPTPKAVINIEGGIRTLPFIGVSGGYFF
jgi:hypothetical protein